MNILIHDLSENEWKKIENKYPRDEWFIISDNKKIQPCFGCFNCWLKTPGMCAIKDGYESTASFMAKCEEIEIITKYTFGGFSSFVKNVIDRSLSYLLPFLKNEGSEMHHYLRYGKTQIPFTVHFYGDLISQEDQEIAKKYVKALCVDLKAKIKSIDFTNTNPTENSEKQELESKKIENKTIFLNCSLRGEHSNTKVFLNKIIENINCEFENYNLINYLNKQDELIEILQTAEKIIFGTPMYVDGMPSSVVRIFEKLNKCDKNGHKKVYFVSNMGFFESIQQVNLLNIAKNWCEKTGYDYYGSIAIGGGESLGNIAKSCPLTKGPMKSVGNAILKLADSISKSEKMNDIYAEPYKLPRFLYILIANIGFKKAGKNHGLKTKDLYKRID